MKMHRLSAHTPSVRSREKSVAMAAWLNFSVRAIAMLWLGTQLAACSSTPTEPEWLSNAEHSYPQSRYLSATGQADDREAADARALANLAKIFEVAVADSSLDFSEARIDSSAGNSAISNSVQASRSVSTEAQQVLQGARIAEHWQTDTGQEYSLAVLEKAPAARRFRSTVQQADTQTEELITYAGGRAPNPVAALAALEQARQLQQQRDSANRSLAIVSGRGIPGKYSQADIEAMIRKGLSTLQFGSQASKPAMLDAVQSAIAALGIQYQKNSAYQVWGALDTEPVTQRQGWYWLRGSMQLSLRHNDESIATRRWPIKVSATDEGMVNQRARDQLSNDLANQLYQLLVSSPLTKP